MNIYFHNLNIYTFALLLHPRCNKHSQIAQYLSSDSVKNISQYFKHVIHYKDNKINLTVNECDIEEIYLDDFISFHICHDCGLSAEFNISIKKNSIYFLTSLFSLCSCKKTRWHKNDLFNIKTHTNDKFIKYIYNEIENSIYDELSQEPPQCSLKKFAKACLLFSPTCKHLLHSIDICLNEMCQKHKYITQKNIDDVILKIAVRCAMTYDLY